MSDVPVKRKRGRPKGSDGRKKKELTVEKLWDSLSIREKKAVFSKATPNQKLQIVSRIEQKANEVPGVTVRLQMKGVPASCPGCGMSLPFGDRGGVGVPVRDYGEVPALVPGEVPYPMPSGPGESSPNLRSPPPEDPETVARREWHREQERLRREAEEQVAELRAAWESTRPPWER